MIFFFSYQGHDLQKIVDLKIELIKLNNIIRYIDILNVQTDGIISPDGFQIINNRQFINRNCICTIDLESKNTLACKLTTHGPRCYMMASKTAFESHIEIGMFLCVARVQLTNKFVKSRHYEIAKHHCFKT